MHGAVSSPERPLTPVHALEMADYAIYNIRGASLTSNNLHISAN